MATKVIKNGTVVTADLSYEADVLIENGQIIEIGKGLNISKIYLNDYLIAVLLSAFLPPAQSPAQRH